MEIILGIIILWFVFSLIKKGVKLALTLGLIVAVLAFLSAYFG